MSLKTLVYLCLRRNFIDRVRYELTTSTPFASKRPEFRVPNRSWKPLLPLQRPGAAYQNEYAKATRVSTLKKKVTAGNLGAARAVGNDHFKRSATKQIPSSEFDRAPTALHRSLLQFFFPGIRNCAVLANLAPIVFHTQ